MSSLLELEAGLLDDAWIQGAPPPQGPDPRAPFSHTHRVLFATPTHVNDDGFPGSPLYIYFLGSSDVQVTQVRLEILVGGLKVEEGLQESTSVHESRSHLEPQMASWLPCH